MRDSVIWMRSSIITSSRLQMPQIRPRQLLITHFPQVTAEISPPTSRRKSDVDEHFRGDPEEDEELALEFGELGIEPLDDTICLRQEVALKGSERLQDPVRRGGPTVAILGIER